MSSIGTNNFHDILPGIVGELAGGIAAVLVAFVGNKLLGCEKPVSQVASINVKESFLGEIPGSVIFLGGVAIAAGGSSILNANISGFVVGASVFLSLALVG